MITYHWNGEFWFKRNWSIFKRVRHWLIWIGGWEKPNGGGWSFRRYNHVKKRKVLKDPAPISLFGHRITIFRPRWFQVRTRHGYFVVSNCDGTTKAYVSPDATPTRAFWFWNAPKEVKEAINGN